MSHRSHAKVGHATPYDLRFWFYRGPGLDYLRFSLPWSWALAGTLGLAGWVGLTACSAAPVKMECQEQRLRLDLESLSEDQRRFGEENLRDCEKRLDSAQAQDSAFIEKMDRRFTPDAESVDGGDSAEPGLDSAEVKP